MLWIILWKRPSLLTMEGVSGESRQLEEMINSSVAFTLTYPCKRPNYLLLALWLIIQICSKKGQSRCNKEHERGKNKVPYSVVCNPNTWTTDSSAMCISTVLTRNTINSTYTRLDLPIGSTTLRKINRAQHHGGRCWEGVSRRNHCRRKWQFSGMGKYGTHIPISICRLLESPFDIALMCTYCFIFQRGWRCRGFSLKTHFSLINNDP